MVQGTRDGICKVGGVRRRKEERGGGGKGERGEK